MSDLGIYTAQNVFIDYKLAGLGDRIVAFIIDLLIMVAYLLVTSILMDGDAGWWQLFITLPIFLYHVLFEVLMNGQSPGKRQMKIQVKMADGSVPGIGAYLMRWLVSPVDFMIIGGLAIVSIIVSQKSQRLGDLAAGTVVAKTKVLDEFHKDFLRRKPDENYEPVFSAVKHKITQKDVDIIKEALRVRVDNTSHTPSEKLRKQLEARLEVSSELATVAFLYTVIKDFDYYQG